MKCILYLLLVLLIQNVVVAAARHPTRTHSRNYNKYAQMAKPQVTAEHESEAEEEPPAEDDFVPESLPELAVDTLQCPRGCVCQYAHFMDLPISRWINYMQRRQPERPESAEELANDNEAMYEGDESFLTNPFIKQATCILQEDNDPAALVNSLPHDLQALILLYTGVGRNKTVNTSILKPLNQLSTLEIRGSADRNFRLVFDEPLDFLQYANFESITLLGSDSFKRPKNPIHPSDSFDYKPRGELYASYETSSGEGVAAATTEQQRRLNFELQREAEIEEIEILPYDVYLAEVRKARMPSFYGWQRLEVLRIHACALSELHWEMFDGLEALEHLSLEWNGIEVLPAFALYGALHIKTLSLAHNRIAELHYRALAGLLELEMLDLSANRLGRLSELSFPPLPRLERVDFRANPLRYIFPAAFWVMNGTRAMQFGSAELALELWANLPFESLHELRELSVANVSVGGSLEHNVFKGLIALEHLKLRGDIRSIEFDAFAGMTELRELDLAECGIREVSMDALIGCRKLEVISLARNKLTQLPPGLFDDQTRLEEIYLEGNQLRQLPGTFFLQPRLRLARLNDNPWQCSCAMALWRSKITNQERGGARTQRCVTDYQTGEKIACRSVDNFKFDHRWAPRCESHNGRSVFYVLRKQLNCGPGRLVRQKQPQQHRVGMIEGGVVAGARRMPKTRQMAERRELYAEKLEQKKKQQQEQQQEENWNQREQQSSAVSSNRLTWQLQREQKMRRTLALQNNLNFVLQQEQRRLALAMKNAIEADDEQEISNNI